MVWCSDISFHVFFRQNMMKNLNSIMVVMQQLQPQPLTVPVGNFCSTQCKFTTLFTIHRTKPTFWEILFFFLFLYLFFASVSGDSFSGRYVNL